MTETERLMQQPLPLLTCAPELSKREFFAALFIATGSVPLASDLMSNEEFAAALEERVAFTLGALQEGDS